MHHNRGYPGQMATYTVDLFTTLDGFGWGVSRTGARKAPSWSSSGPTYREKDQTLVFGANTYRLMLRFAPADEDPSFAPLNAARKIVISRTLESR